MLEFIILTLNIAPAAYKAFLQDEDNILGVVPDFAPQHPDWMTLQNLR